MNKIGFANGWNECLKEIRKDEGALIALVQMTIIESEKLVRENKLLRSYIHEEVLCEIDAKLREGK